ncbi:MAG: hypothetical protein DI525_07230 [Corynebacterium kroppenstedtii]|uniref:Carboxymuconolactone decarboxylase-like domain-containing protein n=1 Tax=Corynebacterium kroppenstedtii TaxID=161879 RepID=A0A2W5SYJ5_9CORY|nr:MAG: hypothetical protein DI525_07230 [Corynebacterium kroppenstedtii]
MFSFTLGYPSDDLIHKFQEEGKRCPKRGTPQEIESILHAGVYAGLPAAVEGAKIAQRIAEEETSEEK